jgi:ATP-dependent Clp protease ATP-binding subunit ClpC
MTGIPLTRLEKAESERLLAMEKELQKTVISQEEPIHSISRAVRRSRSGLKDPRRPVGSFIFLGPTGVGKTLLAKALAKFMFGEEEALIQIDMSEYMEKHNVSRLVGAPPGYVGFEEGGQLTEKVRRRPYSVILFDEVEKAHHDVFNMLLQIMEEGKLTDSFGRHIDFRNTIVIMTSNIGASIIKNQSSLGFRQTSAERSHQEMRKELLEEVDQHFRPEFLNRLDEIIVFHSLDRGDLRQIIDIEVRYVQERMKTQGIHLTLSDEARDHLIEKGYNPDFGARPLRRAIEQFIEDPLAEEVLRGGLTGKTSLLVEVRDDHLFFETTKIEEEPESEPEPEPAGVVTSTPDPLSTDTSDSTEAEES